MSLPFSFQPVTPTSQDDYNILFKGEAVGTFFWNKGLRPEDKIATVRDEWGNVALMPNEPAALQWLVKNWEVYADSKFKVVYNLLKGVAHV